MQREQACVTAGMILLLVGCQPPSAFDDLEALREDANGNGFLDVGVWP